MKSHFAGFAARLVERLPRARSVQVFAAVALAGATSAHAATFTVTNINDGGSGSLRAAITSANAASGADTVAFNIPGAGAHSIAPTSALPVVTQPLTIDGSTQPGYAGLPLVQLNGANVSSGLGLVLDTSNCTVNALTINGWNSVGVAMTGSGTVNSHIQGCLIGLNVTATSAVPNGIGVLISGGANGNFIGGASPSLSNYIGGNTAAGIGINGSSSNTNFITGNIIGTDGHGKTAIPNSVGILISGGSQNNTIGGNSTAVRNLISGNSAVGVSIKDAGTTGNSVAGNYLGMGADGVTKVPNKFGILVSAGASGNTIGASGNGANLISGNLGAGVYFVGSSGNTVTNNVIGADANLSRLPGNGVGVAVTAGSQDNVVGPSNLITSSFTGVDIEGANTSNNSVIGNNIGTSANPTAADPNSPYANFAGVSISGGAQGNTIGGTTGAARNIISGNSGLGVSIDGAGTNGNAVEGNFIGTNNTGDAAIPNSTGIYISGGASFNSIGASGAGNLISGNDGAAVGISGSGTNNNSVQGNTIGANPQVTQVVANGIGVSVDQGARNTLIGGITAGTGNFISGNHGAGIEVKGASIATTVERNYIGSGVGGNGSLPNGQGITIDGNSQFTVVGADKSLSDRDQIGSVANLIANNPVGVSVKGALSYNNTIRGNAFVNNGSTIDLGGDGPTANDDKDGDDGPNRLQNSPIISSVARNSDNTGNEITGTLNSAPNESFIVDIYFKNDGASNTINSNVGQTSVSTDADGNGHFDITSPNADTFDASHYVATATRAGTGDTSEFSASAVVAPNVSITSPASGSRLPGFTSVSGTATSPYGIAHVDLYLIRLSDGKFWDGTSWGGGGSAILPTSYDAATKTWTSTGPLPSSGGTDPNTSFTAGGYDIIAQAYDTNGTMTRADSSVTVEAHASYTFTGLAATCPYADSGACSSFVGGDARDFFDARNWSPQGVPGPNDTATIGNFDVWLDTSDRSKGSVVLGGLNLRGTLNGASLSFSGASGSDNVFNWSGGRLNVATTGINATGTLNLSGDDTKDIGDNGVINNAGTTTFTGNGVLRGILNATFNNLDGATFRLNNDGGVFGVYVGSSTFNNAKGAIFQKQNTISDPASVSTIGSWVFNNNGSIESNTGALEFNTTLNCADGSVFRGTSHTRLSGGEMNVTGLTAIQNTIFDMTGGTIDGTGTPVTTGTTAFNWTAGTLSRLNVDTSSTLNMSGAASKDIHDSGVINNSGHATLSDTGPLRGILNATFNNIRGATFTLASDAGLSTYVGSSTFNNASGATFEKTVGGASTTSQCDWAFNNSGLTKVSQGVLTLNAGGNDAGTFTNDSQGVLRFTNGTHTLQTGTLFNGLGRTQLTGGTVTSVGNASSGTATSPAIFEMSGGSLNSSPKVAFSTFGTFNWTGGQIGGTFNVAKGTAFNLLGSALKDIHDSGVINNSGHATLSGTGPLRGILNGTVNNLSGGTFTLASDTGLSTYVGSSTFNNLPNATFEKTIGGATTPSSVDWAFNNSGLTKVSKGTLSLTAGGTDAGTFSTVSPSIVRFTNGDHTLKTGTLFNGTGKTQQTGGTLVMAGTVASGTSASPATFEMSGGSTRGVAKTSFSSYGTFNWTGGDIGGTLNIAPNAALNMSGTASKDIHDSGVINNSGHATLKDTGPLRGILNGTVNNLKGGTFTLASDNDLSIYVGASTFNNAAGATFEKTVGKAPADSECVWAFNNSGLVKVSQGVFSLRGGGTDVGTFTTVTPGIVHFADGTHTLKTGTTFTGTGKTQVTGGTLSETGLVTSGSAAAGTTLEVSGGTIVGAAKTSLTCYGTVNWTGGRIAGVLNIAPKTAFNLLGTSSKDIGDNGVINNSGVTTWSGTGTLRGILNGTFNNLKGGAFNVNGDGSVFSIYVGGSTFNNLPGATFSKTGGTGATVVDSWTWNQNGLVLANAGLAPAKGPALAFNTVLNVNSGTFGGTRSMRFGGSSLNFAGASTINNTLFEIAGGTVSGTGSVATVGANVGILKWTSGTVNQLTIAKNSTFVIAGSASRDIGSAGVITNNGNAVWTGGDIRGILNSTWNNAPGSTFLDVSKASFTTYVGSSTFKNAGTFNTGLGVGKTTMGWNFTQTGTGVLGVDLNGASANAFDLFNISGSATLAGTVKVTRAANFLPSIGSNFKFLTCGSRVGAFTTLLGGDVDATRKLQLVHNANDVTLTVVSKTGSDTQPKTVLAAPAPTEVPTPAPTEAPAPIETPEPAPTEVPTPRAPISPSGGAA